MLGELKARKVLEGFRGQQVDREALIDLLLKVSNLGVEHGDEIGQLDLNPVIVRHEGLSVVDAKLVKKESTPGKPNRPIRDPATLKPLFYPNSVAIIGASASPEKFGWMLVRNIVEGGYAGKVYPVNPRAPEILGLPAYKSILDIPGDVDLAVICVPFEHVLQSIKECAQKGVKGLAITTGGYQELGPAGHERASELEALLQQYPDMIFVGPNMMGLLNTDIQLYAAFGIETLVPKFKKGGIGLITQSGSVASAFLQNAGEDGLGFTQLIPTGNKMDTDEADFIRFLDANPSVKVIAAQLEGFHNGPRFMEAIRTARKPIVIFKTGRTRLGERVAKSHTAALAANAKVMAGVLKQHRVFVVESSEEFYDLSKALVCLGRVAGRRVMIAETSGGIGIIASDQLDRAGLELPGLDEATKEGLRKVAPSHAVISNPLDIAAIGADWFIKAADVISPDHYDLVWLIFADPVERASEAVQAFRNRSNKPIIVEFSGGGDVETVEKRKIIEMGVPVFPSAERALAFLRYFADPWFAQQ
jgi:acyl-CoA synthetase (NDP forming)